MGVIDDGVKSRGQRNYTTLLQAMATVSQVRIAELMGLSEPTVSELKKQGERVCYLLAAAGLKVVETQQRTYSQEELARWVACYSEEEKRSSVLHEGCTL